MNKTAVWIFSGLLALALILISGLLVQDGSGPFLAVVFHVIPFAMGYGGGGDLMIWLYYIILWTLFTLNFKWVIGLLVQRYHSTKTDQ